jgi:hypothetical protein
VSLLRCGCTHESWQHCLQGAWAAAHGHASGLQQRYEVFAVQLNFDFIFCFSCLFLDVLATVAIR